MTQPARAQFPEIRVQFPPKLQFLFRPMDNKVLYGGRDAVKSWGAARALLLIGHQPDLLWSDGRKDVRIVCARETQSSIQESVHHLLKIQIDKMQLNDVYQVGEAKITGKTTAGGTVEFLFKGLRSLSVSEIKSLEDVDILWCEEAANISKTSWDTVMPTIRKQGAEVWMTFNPELSTDETYKRWVLNPPPKTIVVKTSYRDNIWLSERSKVAIQHMKATSPLDFEYIYEGACRSAVRGAIFGPEMATALKDGRICSVPYNRTRPVETVWDLGYGDELAVWFLQTYDGYYNFIDYLHGSGKTITDYMIELQERKYLYGTDWLPHDGVDAIIHQKLSGQTKDRRMSIEQIMRNAGRSVRIAPKLFITDRINAARTIFPQCRFDQDKCVDGLNCLRHYQWAPPGTVKGAHRPNCLGGELCECQSSNIPLHNWASHGADAFCVAGVAVKQPSKRAPVHLAPSMMDDYSPWG